MLKNKIFILYLVASSIAGVIISIVAINYIKNLSRTEKTYKNDQIISKDSEDNKETIDSVSTKPYCDYSLQRLKGYKYIKPLVDGGPDCESPKFNGLKKEIVSFLSSKQQSGNLTYSSVYIKDLSTNLWMVTNPEQGYYPGSLIKVAVLISILKMAENNPGLLSTTISYSSDHTKYPDVVFNCESIQLGNRYSIKDLLYYMIACSDNRATMLLENILDKNVFTKTFTDVGLRELKFSDTLYRITAKNYSNFLIETYNAGYLTINSSEYAASLLTQCTFKEGITKYLPSDVKVAHKYGKWTDGYFKELHESGIVYMDGHPYLITIMTRGKDWKELCNIISEISKMVYVDMQNTEKAK